MSSTLQMFYDTLQSLPLKPVPTMVITASKLFSVPLLLFPQSTLSYSFEKKMFSRRQQCNATGDGYASKADPTLSPTPI